MIPNTAHRAGDEGRVSGSRGGVAGCLARPLGRRCARPTGLSATRKGRSRSPSPSALRGRDSSANGARSLLDARRALGGTAGGLLDLSTIACSQKDILSPHFSQQDFRSGVLRLLRCEAP